jgi:SAM-dependent methyltransferase
MDVKELSQIAGPPEAHWYYAAKFDLLAETVGEFRAQRILDVGAGSGIFARLLLERTDCREATCVDPAYTSDRDETANGKALRFRRGFEGGDFDLILLMDVLEHVDDDVALLASAAAAAKPGTPVFITVPAFQFLWSAHDVFLEHRRRYTSGMLARTIAGAGLHVERIRYFYATILPAAAVVRVLTRGRDPAKGSDLRPVPAPVTQLIRATLALERRLLFPLNRLAGLSVVAVAKTK